MSSDNYKNITWKGTALKREDHYYIFTDNPETINIIPEGDQVIWHHKIESDDKTKVSYRVLNWHRNLTHKALDFGITLQNNGKSEIKVNSLKSSESFRGGDYFSHGINIASTCLSNKFNFDEPVEKFPPDRKPHILLNNLFRSGPNSPYFAMYAFDLTSETPLNYILRVAVDGENILNRTGEVINREKSHARGTWKYDAIRIKMDEPHDAAATQKSRLRISEHRHGRTAPTTTDDVKLFYDTESDMPEQANSNKGLYGVDLHIDLKFKNDTNREVMIPIHIEVPEELVEDPKAGYCGAFKFKGKTDQIEILGLRPVEHQTTKKLFDIVVPANVFSNSPYIKTFILQHGGTSSLPVDIIIG